MPGISPQVRIDDEPISASCDVPSSAPHSIQNIGFVRPHVVEAQVTSQGQAQTLSDTLCLTQTVSEELHLATPVDPRHDAWQVIRFDGKLWLQTSWTMELRAGGVMSHTMQRAYPVTDIFDPAERITAEATFEAEE